MRLICPNCDAEYEVDASLVPPEGRDVQCSNCSNTWFQERALDPEAAEPEAAQPLGLTPRRAAADPKALDILHQEVKREAHARATEAASLETQPDLGLSAPERLPYSRPRPNQPVEALEETVVDDPALVAAPQREEATKREMLPDIEEINSTLASAPAQSEEDEEVAAPIRRSRFRIGFGLMLMLAAAVLVLYARAPELSTRFPEFAEPLIQYVEFINKLRVMLDKGAQALLAQIDALTDLVGDR